VWAYTGLGESLQRLLKKLVKRIWAIIKEHHKLWCDEELSKFVDQRKKTKLQWLQDPRHTTAHNGKMYDMKITNTARTKGGNI